MYEDLYPGCFECALLDICLEEDHDESDTLGPLGQH
jgi:hypothetical protein